MLPLWKWSVAGCVTDVLVNMCLWNQLGGRAAHLNREGRGCGHRGCLGPRTGWLTVNPASSRTHELSDCNWEINCFPTVWPGVDVLGKCMHSLPRKDFDWEWNFVAFLWEMNSCLFPSLMTRLCWDCICLFLCSKRKGRTGSQEMGDNLCPGLQSPVFQCVSTRCEREDICGCANLVATNCPSLLSGNMGCKMKLMMTPLALGSWHVWALCWCPWGAEVGLTTLTVIYSAQIYCENFRRLLYYKWFLSVSSKLFRNARILGRSNWKTANFQALQATVEFTYHLMEGQHI